MIPDCFCCGADYVCGHREQELIPWLRREAGKARFRREMLAAFGPPSGTVLRMPARRAFSIVDSVRKAG